MRGRGYGSRLRNGTLILGSDPHPIGSPTTSDFSFTPSLPTVSPAHLGTRDHFPGGVPSFDGSPAPTKPGRTEGAGARGSHDRNPSSPAAVPSSPPPRQLPLLSLGPPLPAGLAGRASRWEARRWRGSLGEVGWVAPWVGVRPPLPAAPAAAAFLTPKPSCSWVLSLSAPFTWGWGAQVQSPGGGWRLICRSQAALQRERVIVA